MRTSYKLICKLYTLFRLNNVALAKCINTYMKISELTIKPIQPIAPIAPVAPLKPVTPAKAKINALQTQKDNASAALKTEKQSQQRTRAVTGLQNAQQTLNKVGLS